MKFGKKLQHQLDHTLPEWRPNFLCYKQLKKRLKQLGSTAPMTFLTAAILDGNSTIEVEFLGANVGEELVDSGSRVGELKRELEEDEYFEGRKKRKVGSPYKVDENENAAEDFQEETLAQSVDIIAQAEQNAPRRRAGGQITEKDENFLQLVKTELFKFNSFFLDKEEEFLIRLDVLAERTEKVKERRLQIAPAGELDSVAGEDLMQLHRQLVTLHGEMVLLMNFSSLNYVGLLKILKKYDKHNGANLRQSVHGSVLQQPFFSTMNLKALVERSLACVTTLQSFFPRPGVEAPDMEPARVVTLTTDTAVAAES